MKRLHISLFNHNPMGRKTLIDLIDWVGVGFSELGFQVSIAEEEFMQGIPNLIFESNFRQDALLNLFAGGNKPFPLIIFATEVILQNKFDDWSGNWDGQKRFNDFLSLMTHADGFLTTVPGNVNILRKIAPVTFFEFGFSERLINAVPHEQWQFDYGFAGALTPHRASFLSAISQKGLHIGSPTGGAFNADHSAAVSENQMYLYSIQHSAINICLKQHPNWQLPSPTRLGRIAHSMTGCALERTETITKQSALFPTFDGIDEFLNWYCRIDRAAIRREATDRLNRYRQTLPLNAEIARNIDECPALVS